MPGQDENKSKIRVLVVEDEPLVAQDLHVTLERGGYSVTATVDAAKEALELVRTERPDLVLMDIKLKGEMDGIQAAEIIRAEHNLPVIYLTAYGDKQTLERAKITQPFGYILKPFDDQSLYSNIEMAIYRHQMEARLRQSEQALRRERNDLERRVRERTGVMEQQKQQLQNLAEELNRAVQRERRRVAQLLHDELQQLLAAAKLSLQHINESADEKLQQHVERVGSLLKQCIDLSRSLTTELYPPVLHQEGIAAAMRWLGDWMKDKHGLHVQVEADDAPDVAEENLRAFLFETVREMLFNVVKHAKVDSARLEVIEQREGMLQIIVSDAGAGFDRRKLDPQNGTGFGLLNIHQRVELLGGKLSIQSQSGRGTRTELLMPLAATEKNTERDQQEGPNKQELVSSSPAPHDKPHDVIRVMLVDDHKIVREGIAGLLRQEPDMQVVVDVSGGNEALEMVRCLKPDIVLMDVEMPGLSGSNTTRMLTRELPETRIIALSMYRQRHVAVDMRQAGAAAYLTKDATADDLCQVIRAVHRKLPHEYRLTSEGG